MSFDPFEELESDDEFDWSDFASGREKRVPIVLLLDTSQSMGRDDLDVRPIDELNQALQRWSEVLRQDRELRYRAEIAMITFGGGGVTTHVADDGQAFGPAALFDPPELTAGGVTLMVEAITQTLALIEQRKRELDQQRISRVRPLIFLMTDGAPTDRTGHLDESWRLLAPELNALVKDKRFLLTAFGVAGADFEVLEALAPGSTIPVGAEDFYDLLLLVSASAGQADPVEALREALAGMNSSA